MALTTLYSTDLGVRRLLAQPKDLAAPVEYRALGEADAGHVLLFGQYQEAIRTAYDMGAAWWEALINSQQATSGGREEAIRDSFNKRIGGAAAHPYVVWTIRRFWLACAQVNDGLEPAARVAPEDFLLQWLIDAGETEHVRLLACMPYWPIGLDENGRWC
jgi:hypothetical protein